MRDRLWLTLRRSRLIRRCCQFRLLSSFIRTWSSLAVPPARRVCVRVLAGPGKGLLVRINPRWEHALWEGSYEPITQEVVQRFCRPGSVFFDVGANFGYYSMLAARTGAKVVAFEPDLALAEDLRLHAKLNGLEDRIELQRVAVFSRTGEVFLDPAGENTAHGSAHVCSLDVPEDRAVRVPCTTLDDFVAGHLAPGLMKIDVEGAESDVLMGAERAFELTRPLVLCEVHDAANDKFVTCWLERKRYKARWLVSPAQFPRQLFGWPDERTDVFPI